MFTVARSNTGIWVKVTSQAISLTLKMAPQGTCSVSLSEAPSEMIKEADASAAPAVFQNCSTVTVLPSLVPAELLKDAMSASLARTSFSRVIL